MELVEWKPVICRRIGTAWVQTREDEGEELLFKDVVSRVVHLV